MYLHVNDFDYDSLIVKLIEMYELNDAPVTSDFIKKAFTDLSIKFKKHMRGDLTPDETILVETFLRWNMGWENYQRGDSTESFWESQAENIQNSLSGLYECLIDPELVIPESLEKIIRIIYSLTEHDITTEEGASELIVLIESLVSSYTPVDFNETELDIISQMAGNVLFATGIRDITVIDHAGKTVKYGDTLITFPIILIEVLDHE